MPVLKKLAKAGLIKPPTGLVDNMIYETVMGSEAYSLTLDSSDKDIYGIYIPTKEDIFPHLAGKLFGFDKIEPIKPFQKHHIYKQDEDKVYDVTVYTIVHFFTLAKDCNPNIIDSLYTPLHCVTLNTTVGDLLRSRRDVFISKKAYHTFKGYAYGQLKNVKSTDKKGKRKELIDKYGYDVKGASHLLRLLYECEDILENGTITDLGKHKEQLKAVKEGHYTEKQIYDAFSKMETHLEQLYRKCSLPIEPNYFGIKQLLLDCLESHYGNLNNCIRITQADEAAFATELKGLMKKYGYT